MENLFDLINKEKNILYIGEKPREITLDFIECSELVLQPSRIEGIPRVSIETLSLQKKYYFHLVCQNLMKWIFF